jgi:hypothetical protein
MPVHSFDLTDGSMLGIGMVQATDGNLYGTTTSGGPSACVQHRKAKCNLKGESNASSHKVALICAGMRFECDRGSRSVYDSAAEAWPRSEKTRSDGW